MLPTTVRERCLELRLTVYDTAIPFEWAEAVKAKTGDWPADVVWCYDDSLLGYPVALTPEAEGILEAHKS